MADLVLSGAQGWEEVTDAVHNSDIDLSELWQYAAQGLTEDIIDYLDAEIGDDLEQIFGKAPLKEVRIIAVPDDILGEFIRVWARARE